MKYTRYEFKGIIGKGALRLLICAAILAAILAVLIGFILSDSIIIPYIYKCQ